MAITSAFRLAASSAVGAGGSGRRVLVLASSSRRSPPNNAFMSRSTAPSISRLHHHTVTTVSGAAAAVVAGNKSNDSTASTVFQRLSALAVAAATATVLAYNNSGEESMLGKINKAHCMTITAVVGKDDYDARYVYVYSLLTASMLRLRAFTYTLLYTIIYSARSISSFYNNISLNIQPIYPPVTFLLVCTRILPFIVIFVLGLALKKLSLGRIGTN